MRAAHQSRGWLLKVLPLVSLTAWAVLLSGCQSVPRTGSLVPRRGDEIIVAGQFVHTGTRVVTWLDPGGYDAYRVERRFSKPEESGWDESKAAVKDLSTPNRYGLRKSAALTTNELERVRSGGWDLPTLQKVVDQFVIHYDVCGTSRQCFKVLHDLRGLSVHFLLDLDGTIYQTLDLKERAWHATSSNTRSVGVEIAHMGAYAPGLRSPLDEWYRRAADGQIRLQIPARFGDGGIRTPHFVGRPARPDMIPGKLQGRELVQYDYTPEQYAALVKLTAALCKVFPQLRCDYPRDASGQMVLRKLPDDELGRYQGVLGHFHIQTNKVDPGPAFQWDFVIENARRLMTGAIAARSARPEKGATRLLATPAP